MIHSTGSANLRTHDKQSMDHIIVHIDKTASVHFLVLLQMFTELEHLQKDSLNVATPMLENVQKPFGFKVIRRIRFKTRKNGFGVKSN